MVLDLGSKDSPSTIFRLIVPLKVAAYSQIRFELDICLRSATMLSCIPMQQRISYRGAGGGGTMGFDPGWWEVAQPGMTFEFK